MKMGVVNRVMRFPNNIETISKTHHRIAVTKVAARRGLDGVGAVMRLGLTCRVHRTLKLRGPFGCERFVLETMQIMLERFEEGLIQLNHFSIHLQDEKFREGHRPSVILHHLVSGLVAGIAHRHTVGIGAGGVVLSPHGEGDDVLNRSGIGVVRVQWPHDGFAGRALFAVPRLSDLNVPRLSVVGPRFRKFHSVFSGPLKVGMSVNKKMQRVIVVCFNHVYHEYARITRKDSNP